MALDARVQILSSGVNIKNKNRIADDILLKLSQMRRLGIKGLIYETKAMLTRNIL